MTLYLVQHGEAVPEELDSERPLSAAGRADVQRLAAFLKGCGLGLDRVLHSGKARARETAEVLAAALAPGYAPEAVAGMKPNDSARDFAATVAAFSGDVLLAGHQPFLGRLVSYLLLGREDLSPVGFVPGTFVSLERVEPPGWQIACAIPPGLLRGTPP
jgi:phosphohistidine phosphatase